MIPPHSWLCQGGSRGRAVTFISGMLKRRTCARTAQLVFEDSMSSTPGLFRWLPTIPTDSRSASRTRRRFCVPSAVNLVETRRPVRRSVARRPLHVVGLVGAVGDMRRALDPSEFGSSSASPLRCLGGCSGAEAHSIPACPRDTRPRRRTLRADSRPWCCGPSRRPATPCPLTRRDLRDHIVR